MTDGSDYAFPLSIDSPEYSVGLTKREWVAGQVLKGLVSNPNIVKTKDLSIGSIDSLTELALMIADNQIEALN